VRTAEGREGEGGGEGEGRGGRCVRAEVPQHPRGHARVCTDASAFVRTHGRVRVDAPCFIPCNFKKDATVRPSHECPRSHRPIVRPSVHKSVRKRPRDNHDVRMKNGFTIESTY
jgi:hypothetical protein